MSNRKSKWFYAQEKAGVFTRTAPISLRSMQSRDEEVVEVLNISDLYRRVMRVPVESIS